MSLQRAARVKCCNEFEGVAAGTDRKFRRGQTVAVPGTFNPDTNPARIAPRHLFDLGTGLENVFRTEPYHVNLTFTVVNLTNKVALYNFLSTFSGTHFVTPRSYQASLGVSF